jgi:metal-dependent amidase/aminoacylase/carboxypeptidase family protein
VRSPRLETLENLKERVLTCLQAGATAAGCDFEFEWQDPAYAELVENDPLIDRYVANARRLGREPEPPDRRSQVVGSTDMGNVSHLVPSIHPMIKVAPAEVSIHTPVFADYAASPDGDQAVLDGAKALALTVADLWSDAALRADAQRDLSVSGAS